MYIQKVHDARNDGAPVLCSACVACMSRALRQDLNVQPLDSSPDHWRIETGPSPSPPPRAHHDLVRRNRRTSGRRNRHLVNGPPTSSRRNRHLPNLNSSTSPRSSRSSSSSMSRMHAPSYRRCRPRSHRSRLPPLPAPPPPPKPPRLPPSPQRPVARARCTGTWPRPPLRRRPALLPGRRNRLHCRTIRASKMRWGSCRGPYPLQQRPRSPRARPRSRPRSRRGRPRSRLRLRLRL